MALAVPPASYADRFVTANGAKLHFQDWNGPAGAPTLLMVHGITMQSHAFDPVAAALKQRYRCLAMDLRGHGDSAWTEPPAYAYTDYSGDVLALLDALAIDKVHYLGTSLGGRIGMTIAASHPERLASVALNDISPEQAGAGLARIAEVFGAERPPLPSVEAYVEQVLLVYARRMKALPREMLVQAARWHLRPVPGGFRPKFDPRALRRLGDEAALAAGTEMLWRGFRALRCPLLLIRGKLSDILLPEAVRLMQAAQPAMKVVEVPGVGHPPALVEPAAQQALAAFLPGE